MEIDAAIAEIFVEWKLFKKNEVPVVIEGEDEEEREWKREWEREWDKGYMAGLGFALWVLRRQADDTPM